MKTQDLIARNLEAIESREPGDIIFFHPENFNPLAAIILFVTGQYYHHGGIVIDRDNVIESDPLKGVHISPIEGYLDKYTLDLFRLKKDHDGQLIVDAAKKYLGWNYDYGNLVWAGLGFAWLRLTGISVFRRIKNPDDESGAVHSEEFIDSVFRDAGFNLRPEIPSTNITAQDMADSDLLFRVYAI